MAIESVQISEGGDITQAETTSSASVALDSPASTYAVFYEDAGWLEIELAVFGQVEGLPTTAASSGCIYR